jgi:hypothetical protein
MKNKLEVLQADYNPNGSITVSALENGHLVHETFYGYSKNDAVRRFVRERKKLSKFDVMRKERKMGYVS